MSATAGTALRLVGYLVLVLMIAAILYAGVITLSYWHGIGV